MSRRLTMLLWTSGIRYDDRVRKEARTIRDMGYAPRVIVLEYANDPYVRRDPSGFDVEAVRLRTRRWFRRGGGLAVKIAELYPRLLRRAMRSRPAVVWIHNLELAGLIPAFWLLRKVGAIDFQVWDQHELPPPWMVDRSWGRFLARRLLGMVDHVIVANPQRKAYLLDRVGTGTPVHVLENFVDRQFCDDPVADLPEDLQGWLQGRPYLLAPGGANAGRYLGNVVDAALSHPDLRLVVVGPYDEDEKADLRERFGGALDDRVRFTGLVPLTALPAYFDHAWASVILYADDFPNNRLCAPNRLYQSIARGVPVIVGDNPPMAEVVRRFGCGLVLPDDGYDVEGLREGIGEMKRRREEYREMVLRHRDRFVWGRQDDVVRDILAKSAS